MGGSGRRNTTRTRTPQRLSRPRAARRATPKTKPTVGPTHRCLVAAHTPAPSLLIVIQRAADPSRRTAAPCLLIVVQRAAAAASSRRTAAPSLSSRRSARVARRDDPARLARHERQSHQPELLLGPRGPRRDVPAMRKEGGRRPEEGGGKQGGRRPSPRATARDPGDAATPPSPSPLSPAPRLATALSVRRLASPPRSRSRRASTERWSDGAIIDLRCEESRRAGSRGVALWSVVSCEASRRVPFD